MSAERVKELLELMKAYGLASLDLEDSGFKVRLVSQAGQPAAASLAPVVAPLPCLAPAGPAAPFHGPLALAAPPPAAPADDESGWLRIKSPIIGTFYRASSPEAEPFVAEGSRVGKDTVVCIVDAMKTMNEIKAEVSGTVMRILVENGEPVEFDQPLFAVRP